MSYKEINGKRTLPLNGWRTRVLAEYLFGSSEAETKFDDGMRFIIPATTLQKLPQFDEVNQVWADQFSGDVVCEVEFVDRSYGIHISVEEAPDIMQMNRVLPWGRWSDLVRVGRHSNHRGEWLTVYWKDIRPEDEILTFRAEMIPGYTELRGHNDLGNGNKWWCDDDLVFRVIQTYGARLHEKIEKAGVL